MKLNFMLRGLLGAAAIFGATTLTSPANAQTYTTTFRCDRSGEHYETIAVVFDGVYETKLPALIRWETREFGSNYTPEERCKIVSNKLADAVRENSDSLSDLVLETGRVNGYQVICYVNIMVDSGCNRDNQLFTLSRNNRGRLRTPEQVLGYIRAYANNRADEYNPIRESASSVNLERLVERLRERSLSPSRPVSPSRPGRLPPGTRI